MIKKIVFTDSPEETDRKYSDKMIITRDPASFLRYIEGLR